MNIIEAIKSGKPYRRKNDLEFFTPGDEYDFTYSEVLSEEWEVEQTPVTITREKFDDAWRRALDVSENMEITTQRYLYELVIRELGL
jgi:hypothetical protein